MGCLAPPTHGLDLVPSYFYLFVSMAMKRFADNIDLVERVIVQFKSSNAKFYGIHFLTQQWGKGFDVDED